MTTTPATTTTTGAAAPSRRGRGGGDGFCFDDACIHRMPREPDAGDTVTIHAYSPPLLRVRLGRVELGQGQRLETPSGGGGGHVDAPLGQDSQDGLSWWEI